MMENLDADPSMGHYSLLGNPHQFMPLASQVSGSWFLSSTSEERLFVHEGPWIFFLGGVAIDGGGYIRSFWVDVSCFLLMAESCRCINLHSARLNSSPAAPFREENKMTYK